MTCGNTLSRVFSRFGVATYICAQNLQTENSDELQTCTVHFYHIGYRIISAGNDCRPVEWPNGVGLAGRTLIWRDAGVGLQRSAIQHHSIAAWILLWKHAEPTK